MKTVLRFLALLSLLTLSALQSNAQQLVAQSQVSGLAASLASAGGSSVFTALNGKKVVSTGGNTGFFFFFFLNGGIRSTTSECEISYPLVNHSHGYAQVQKFVVTSP